ncbi:AraC family transcriptional regulator [Mucilaginibacter sp. UR6-1]|uniref:AraC family transcriptional regulator n=1 Tax=Mucilaginibacter sp. UR6-1 TaxID=1435643 RepID=UPI001E5C0749|nr:AraC family transcriptional regulator [Mucilaginibacter sp. UR6-1]MCC8408140.1 AraC family transcriptional regulator [Mucilaginibacter sp. UR6-1]
MELFEEKILLNDRLFVAKEEHFPFNDFPLHIHPEYELIYILKSSGTRYVGDHIDLFHARELCLFGPNLPHTFYNKHLPADREVHQFVIQFNEDFLGSGFFDRPQFNAIKSLFKSSLNGIRFSQKTMDEVDNRIRALVCDDEAQAVAGLISVLATLARADDFEVLASQRQTSSSIKKDTARMNRIYHYLLDNFKEEITVQRMAAMANLSVPAFCRYFKAHTRKTLSDFINELRINYACQLLQLNDKTISQICFESGYNNISYFNRQFKSITGTSPLAFKKKTSQY